MVWIILFLVLIVFFFGVLVLPMELKIDTRIPVATIHWKGIGKAILIFEEEWWLKVRLPFFHEQWLLMQLILSDKKKEKKVKPVQIKKRKRRMPFSKVLNMLKSFQLIKLEVAISNSDYITNASLYFLNFLPQIHQHVHVNFEDENYFALVIRNKIWRVVYAFIKQ